MKARFSFLLVTMIAVCTVVMPCNAQEEVANAEAVYVIPIKGPVERALLYVIRRGLSEAEKEGAAAILGLHPNTLRNKMKNLGILFGRKYRHVYKTASGGSF